MFSLQLFLSKHYLKSLSSFSLFFAVFQSIFCNQCDFSGFFCHLSQFISRFDKSTDVCAWLHALSPLHDFVVPPSLPHTGYVHVFATNFASCWVWVTAMADPAEFASPFTVIHTQKSINHLYLITAEQNPHGHSLSVSRLTHQVCAARPRPGWWVGTKLMNINKHPWQSLKAMRSHWARDQWPACVDIAYVLTRATAKNSLTPASCIGCGWIAAMTWITGNKLASTVCNSGMGEAFVYLSYALSTGTQILNYVDVFFPRVFPGWIFIPGVFQGIPGGQ